jgi:hypothetical protein
MNLNIKMNRSIGRAAGMALSLTLALAAPARAHHSYAMFDESKTVVLTGTVEKWGWTNPHTFLEIRVPAADGTETLWEIEGASPSFLARIGLTRNTFAAGEKVSVTTHPRRDGKSVGNLMMVTKSDGKVINVSNRFPKAGEVPEAKK